MKNKIEAALFDLDGVVVFTDKYHYLAWKKLCDARGLDFNESINDSCRGVPRMESLDVILRHNQVQLNPEEKTIMADQKNRCYVHLLGEIAPSDIYPGVVEFIRGLKHRGLKTGICSSSRNARIVLERLDLTHCFDAVVTGDEITKAKPDPEIFLVGACRLSVSPDACVVFEDAPAGIDAAHAAGMKGIGVGESHRLNNALHCIQSYSEIDLDALIQTGTPKCFAEDC